MNIELSNEELDDVEFALLAAMQECMAGDTEGRLGALLVKVQNLRRSASPQREVTVQRSPTLSPSLDPNKAGSP